MVFNSSNNYVDENDERSNEIEAGLLQGLPWCFFDWNRR